MSSIIRLVRGRGPTDLTSGTEHSPIWKNFETCSRAQSLQPTGTLLCECTYGSCRHLILGFGLPRCQLSVLNSCLHPISSSGSFTRFNKFNFDLKSPDPPSCTLGRRGTVRRTAVYSINLKASYTSHDSAIFGFKIGLDGLDKSDFCSKQEYNL